MPWATPDTVARLLADDLGVQLPDLADAWAGRLELAVPQARREIETALNARAYTPAEILACDWLLEEHQELAVVAALLKGGSLASYDVQAVRDRYAMIQQRLKTQPVYVNGVPVFPGRVTPDGQSVAVAGGTLTGAADAYGATDADRARRRIDPNEGY